MVLNSCHAFKNVNGPQPCLIPELPSVISLVHHVWKFSLYMNMSYEVIIVKQVEGNEI